MAKSYRGRRWKGANDISRLSGSRNHFRRRMGIQGGVHSSVARFRVFYKTASGVAIVESRFESPLLREARLEPEATIVPSFTPISERENCPFICSLSREGKGKGKGGLIGSGCRRYSSLSLWNGMDTVLEIFADLSLSRETDSTPRLNDRFNVLL